MKQILIVMRARNSYWEAASGSREAGLYQHCPTSSTKKENWEEFIVDFLRTANFT
jgi:hypothetical protein